METNNPKQLKTVRLRQPKLKKTLLEQLERTPIIQVACERAGIGRATFYRWRDEDEVFKKSIEKALAEGELFISDISESQLITLIKEKNWPAISFWLKYHHPKYAQRLEITANLNQKQEELTPEQAETVREALRLASLAQADNSETENNSNKNNQYEQTKSSTPHNEAQLPTPTRESGGKND